MEESAPPSQAEREELEKAKWMAMALSPRRKWLDVWRRRWSCAHEQNWSAHIREVDARVSLSQPFEAQRNTRGCA